MKRKFFGTDGVRGEFGGPVMNPVFAWRLGVAVGRWLGVSGAGPRSVLIGRDTRYSGAALQSALAQGLSSTGADVATLGVVPTPAVSFGVRRLHADLGVVVTASHNPATDNGIKFFSSQGTKLDDGEELSIESLLPPTGEAPTFPDPDWPLTERNVVGAYLGTMAEILGGGALSGWRIAVDTANGAAHHTTPTMLRRLGAEVHVVCDQPDGSNINAECGSQHPERLKALVIETGSRVGFAHDGDADRVVFVDENGEVLDGDEVLAILAGDALARGRLNENTLVATVQSNLGLRRFMEESGGRLIQTSVGDRYVAEAMLAGGFNLGGENSGHIICTDVSPCGDGLAAALFVLRAMLAADRPLSELRRGLTRFPQLSQALRVPDKPELSTLPTLRRATAEAEAELGEKGRVLIRYSGTEPKLRLLVEGMDAAVVKTLMEKLASAVRIDLPSG